VDQGLFIIVDSWSHSVTHTTLGKTPLDEWSARRRDLYLTTHNTHNRQTSMSPAGFEPTIPASELCRLMPYGRWDQLLVWLCVSLLFIFFVFTISSLFILCSDDHMFGDNEYFSIYYIRINLLTPNVNYSGRTAPLTSKVAFYIFIQQI